MVTLVQIEKLLDTYSFQEILELNNLTEAEAVDCLIEHDLILELPFPRPVDYDTSE